MKKIVSCIVPIIIIIGTILVLSIIPIVRVFGLALITLCISYIHIENCKDRHSNKDMLIGDLVLIIAMTMMLTISIVKMLL